MSVESLTRWHWVAIGLAAGMLLGGARLLWRDDLAHGTTAILPQAVFERELPQHAPDGAPRLDRLVVYPADADGRTWITGERLVPSFGAGAGEGAASGPQLAYEPFRFSAKAPYRPLNTPAPADPQLTIVDYLARVKSGHPDARFTYRRAWWATDLGTMSLWTAGGALAIGGVWPVVLNLLVGAGFGRRPKEPDYDLDRFKSESAPPRPAADDGAEARRHLEALEQELIEHLSEASASEPASAAAAPVAAPPPPAALDTRPSEPPPPPTQDGGEPKEFGGEFYPTTFWGPTHHDDNGDGGTPPREPRE